MARVVLLLMLSLSMITCSRGRVRTDASLPWSSLGEVHAAGAPSLELMAGPDGLDRTPFRVRATRVPTGSKVPATVLPGEFEPAEYLIVGWNQDLEEFLLDMVEASWGQARLIIMFSTTDHTVAGISGRLRERGLSPEDVTFVHTLIDSPWVRDYGPLVVQHASGGRSVVDTRYFVDNAEDQIPDLLATELWSDWPHVDMPVRIEGGNILSDGTGRCFTTLGYDGEPIDLLMSPDNLEDTDKPLDPRFLAHELNEKLGCRDIFNMPPLRDEPTGHVDMYLTLTAPGEAIVGRYQTSQDPFNASRLDEAAHMLTRRGIKVRRVPMPDNSDGLFRTYTNSLAVNDVVLVPVYPERDRWEARALQVFREAYPDRTIVPIVATDAIDLQGTVHCMTMTVNTR